MTGTWAALTHGSSAVVISYLAVLLPMVIALVRAGAPLSKLVRAPLLSVFMLIAAVFLDWLIGFPLHALGLRGDGFISVAIGFALAVALGYAGGESLASDPKSRGEHQRGAVISDFNESDRGTRQARPTTGRKEVVDEPSVTLAGIKLSLIDETKHFKLIGTTGTGKSTAIREILNAALARGDRAIIADPDGGYLQHFFDAERGDVILNPFEPDSVKWNLLSEVNNEYDVDQLARSLIPDGGSDKSWSEYARTFFTCVTQQAIKGGIRDDGEVYRLLTKAPSQELKILLSGTAAGPFLEEANERMFGSIRSVTSSAVHALKYTTQQRGIPFSVRQWVREGSARCNGGRGGVLFLPYRAGDIAALRAVISAWMRIAIFQAMDQPEGDQRLWFVIDELDALGEIDGLKDALARLRKFGGRCILGFQSISQVSATYGKGVADTIVENCGNTLILRCSASEHGGTSQFASRLIGQREVMHTSKSRTRRPTDWMASTTTSEHRTIEPAIMASEIERLPDLHGFLKLASNPDWMPVRLRYVDTPPSARARPERPMVTPDAVAAPVPEASIPAAKARGSKSRAVAKKRTRAPGRNKDGASGSGEIAKIVVDGQHDNGSGGADPPALGAGVVASNQSTER